MEPPLTLSFSLFFFLQLYAGTKMRRNSTYKAATPTNRTLVLPTLQLLLLLLVASSVGVSAQCPWQRDVPDLQTSCICAYNLGRELSVQCDQVSKALGIEKTTDKGLNAIELIKT